MTGPSRLSTLLGSNFTAIRIPGANRMADRRTDLGSPITYELADLDHQASPDAALHSRYFRLDDSGDWPRVVEVTGEVQTGLRERQRRAAALLAEGESQRQQHIDAAGEATPVEVLRARCLDGGPVVVDFRREGKTGEQVRTIADAAGEVGAPAGETLTPLSVLLRLGHIDVGQARAGEVFANAFTEAALPLTRAAGHVVERVPGGDPDPDLPPEVAAARSELQRYLDAAGGHAGVLGSALFHVVGAGEPVSAWRTSRHFSRGWLTEAEAAAAVRTALATLRGYLDAGSIEHQHRHRGLRLRFRGAVEASFLIGARRFTAIGQYDATRRAWVICRVLVRPAVPGQKPTTVRLWCVSRRDLAAAIEDAVATAEGVVRLLRNK